MALLQKVRILSNERLDLPDWNNLQNFVCADFDAIHKNVWTNENFVLSGFEASGIGTSVLSVAIAGSTTIVGADHGTLFIGAPSLSPIQTSTLTPNARNYVEITIEQDSGGADSRAFWDKTASTSGGEFSQIVDTYLFTKAAFAVNTVSFTGSSDKVALAYVDVDNSGIITAIVDQRPMFFRLGRPNNSTYSFNWTNGRSAENPAAPSYSDPDKHITSLKSMLDSLMDSVREIKGTNYWYEAPFVSLVDSFQSNSLTILTAATATAKFKWTGTLLQISDASVAPGASDPISFIRFFNSTANLTMLRQDVPLSNGDVLWVEIPKPLSSINYDSVGSSSTNYRVSPRGAVPLDDSVFWLAYVEGTKVFLRGLGELEIGEEQEINDTYALALQQFLGFDPEVATSVPYPFLPSSLIWTETFTSDDTLVQAIGVNANNINVIGTMLDENAYEETIELVPGAPATDFELTGPIVASTSITLPPDTRDSLAIQQYVVGDGVLHVYHDGQFMVRGRDFNEDGIAGSLSDSITILKDLEIGELLTFRMDSLGGYNVGSGGGGGDVVGATNLGAGSGTLYKQKVAGNLQFRTLTAGAGISIVQSGDQIIISTTGGTPTPYFRSDLTGQSAALIGTGGSYNLGTDKLEVYRGGVLMLNSLSLGLDEDRYQEATNNSISLDPAAPATVTEIFTFVNQANLPSYKTLATGLTGTVLTVPAYTMGNDSLKVFRNGIMMNSSSIGAATDQYSETSSTSITLTQTTTSGEVFTFIGGPVLSSREDISGVTGTVLTLSNSYSIGSSELLVYRNGALIYNTTTIGNLPDRYQETTSNSITLADAALVTETFTFIIK